MSGVAQEGPADLVTVKVTFDFLAFALSPSQYLITARSPLPRHLNLGEVESVFNFSLSPFLFPLLLGHTLVSSYYLVAPFPRPPHRKKAVEGTVNSLLTY
jgi:hypothetical protein